jgi:prephenate dehydrogenase
MKIVISGLGLMGASLALSIRQNIENVRLVGHDFPEIETQALKRGIIDDVAANWPHGLTDADLVFLCSPLKVIKKQLREIAQLIGENTVVTDIGSTKEELAKLAAILNFKGIYVGGHPMTGAEKNGLDAADVLLYENAVYVICNPSPSIHPQITEKLFPVLEAIKARILLLDAAAHDKIMAAISHLPQLIAVSLINLAGEKNANGSPYFELAAGGFRDLTRIASSSIEVWQDIISSNRENVKKILEDFIKVLKKNSDKMDDLNALFEDANNFRQQLPRKTKGFLSPLTDVLAQVTDETGAVAKISIALWKKNIDIRDIELLKVREKEGGVFRLSFSHYTEAEQAVEVLHSINYKAHIRE